MQDRESEMRELTGKLLHDTALLVKNTESADSVLVNCIKLSGTLGLTTKIHLTEHIQGRLFASTSRWTALAFKRAD
jgi:hypothetical protein